MLARGDDLGAWAVAVAVARRRGRDAVVQVRPEQLARGRWQHRVSSTGARTTVTLPGGPDLVDTEIRAVLNRIDGIPPLRFLRSSDRDRDYAGAELQALYVSWLHGLECLVVNPVDAHGPLGRWSRLRWLTLAAEHGISVADWRLDASHPDESSVRPPHQEVLVVGKRALGPLSAECGPACVAAAATAGCSLVAFRFTPRDPPRLTEVDPSPGLYDLLAVEAVAELLLDGHPGAHG